MVSVEHNWTSENTTCTCTSGACSAEKVCLSDVMEALLRNDEIIYLNRVAIANSFTVIDVNHCKSLDGHSGNC